MLRANPTRIELRDVDIKEYDTIRASWKKNNDRFNGEAAASSSTPNQIYYDSQTQREEDAKQAKNARHARLGYDKTTK